MCCGSLFGRAPLRQTEGPTLLCRTSNGLPGEDHQSHVPEQRQLRSALQAKRPDSTRLNGHTFGPAVRTAFSLKCLIKTAMASASVILDVVRTCLPDQSMSVAASTVHAPPTSGTETPECSRCRSSSRAIDLAQRSATLATAASKDSENRLIQTRLLNH